MSLKSFTDSYIECALWSSTDEDDIPLDSAYTLGHLSAETKAKIEADCKEFYDAHSASFEQAMVFAGAQLRGTPDECAGHDFWLTRNGHGAGFWDGDWYEPAATTLTAAARACGSFTLYVGDDGQIWGS